MSELPWLQVLGTAALVLPFTLAATLGVISLLGWNLGEVATARGCRWTLLGGLAATLGVLTLMLFRGSTHEAIELGSWVSIPGYHFSFKLVFDRLSVPMAVLTFLLCATIAEFAVRYMHREPGFNRFFVLFAFFVLGMLLTALAGTIETLFAGWELVGLSSALLVAFFQERPAPCRNGLWVWGIYRVSDAALLLAAILMHHLHGKGDFDQLLGAVSWPDGQALVSSTSALVVGLLLIVAAAGKSALLPFSGWLPRAMEGPTPSSAVFYGALSVHLGAYLLMRMSPLLEASLSLSLVVVTLGLATALFAYLVGSVQTDIKSALAFASLVQVGLIVTEVGLGWHYLALIHLLGNACLRTLQFLRAPSLLQDYHLLENALGERLSRPASLVPTWSERMGLRLYRFALARGELDASLITFVLVPFARFFRRCTALENSWTNWLTGGRSYPRRDGDRQPLRMEDYA